jgi:hypothetical protein
MSSHAYVITMRTPRSHRRYLWNGKDSLRLGYSARSINKPKRHIDHLQIGGASLRIVETHTLKPVYNCKAKLPAQYQVYSCFGNWAFYSEELHGEYNGASEEGRVFRLSCLSEGWLLEPLIDDLNLSNGRLNARLRKGKPICIGEGELVHCVIRTGKRQWLFGSASDVKLEPRSSDCISHEGRKFFRIFMTCLISLLGVGLILQRPHLERDVIPAQYAKIVLENASPEREKKSDVTAFRSEELQHSVETALKSGMTRLLKESNLIDSKGNTEQARRILGSTLGSFQAFLPVVGFGPAVRGTISGFGGAGLSKGAGVDVGYAAGAHPMVQGQGHSMVKMDISAASIEEGLTRDEVGEVIHRHLNEVRYCYESSMLRHPDLEGRLVVGFAISGSGAVNSAVVRSSSLLDPKLDDCILRRLIGWQFPNTKGGVNVAVTYPFIFKSLGR